MVVILLMTGNRLEADRTSIEHKFESYKKDQTVLVANLNSKAKAKESEWSQKIAEVEHNAAIKINQANDARRLADINASRLSKQLNSANDRLAKASREASVNYAITANSILESCIGEYRQMAEKADGHAIDAERLSGAWPKGE